MPVQDLREWIARVDELGELTRVSGADAEYELGGLVDLYQWEMGNPALLFDQIRGYRPNYRLLANVFTSLPRVALSLNLPLEYGPRDFVQAWRTQLKDIEPQTAVLQDRGPVLENVQRGDAVDLTQFPAPLWHRDDGGRFVGTGCIVIMRDPDTGWINAGTYRVQAHDPHTAGIYISPGKHGRLIRQKYWERGQACPVAVSVGHDPLLLLLGGLEVPYGHNEFDLAGAIRGEPLRLVTGPVTGLPIPATAEMVFEGEIRPGEGRMEGPFGEWTGYYASGEKEEPIIRVQSILHRDDPIMLGCIPGMPPNDNTFFRSPLRAALIWDELDKAGVPGITGLWSHEAGGGRLFNIVSIKQMYPGHSKQVGMAVASCHAGSYANRFVVVVDDDIDPTDTNQVLWALCTRTDVSEDIDIVRRCWSTPLDPMAYAVADPRGEQRPYYNDRMIIDACRPYHRLQSFPAVARVSFAEAGELRARWPELFDSLGKVRRTTREVNHTTAGIAP